MQLAVVQRRHYYLGQVKYWKCARIPSTGCQFTRCCTGALRWLIYCSTWETLADFKATLVYLHDCSHHPKCLDFVKGKQSTCNLHEPWHRHRMLIKISDPREFSRILNFCISRKMGNPQLLLCLFLCYKHWEAAGWHGSLMLPSCFWGSCANRAEGRRRGHTCGYGYLLSTLSLIILYSM